MLSGSTVASPSSSVAPRSRLTLCARRVNSRCCARCSASEGAAVAGESVEDLLGALVPGKGSGGVVQWLESPGCQGRPQEAPYPWGGLAHSLRCTDTSVRSTPPKHRHCTSASPSP